MTLRVDGKLDYVLILPANEKCLDAVKARLDIDAFADTMFEDIRLRVSYIGELISDTDCPAVDDYNNDFSEAFSSIMTANKAVCGAGTAFAPLIFAARHKLIVRRSVYMLNSFDVHYSNGYTGGLQQQNEGAEACLLWRSEF